MLAIPVSVVAVAYACHLQWGGTTSVSIDGGAEAAAFLPCCSLQKHFVDAQRADARTA